LVFLNLIMIGGSYLSVQTNYIIGQWAADPETQQTKFKTYTYQVFAYATGASLVTFFKFIIVFSMSFRSSRKIHRKMITHVLNAPMNLFFDVTPTGTILNRFSKDLATHD
jgi:ABC-type multidrug transport system fused ATPase/permease subunit